MAPDQVHVNVKQNFFFKVQWRFNKKMKLERNEPLENVKVLVVADAFLERNVEAVVLAIPHADVLQRARAREEALLVFVQRICENFFRKRESVFDSVAWK